MYCIYSITGIHATILYVQEVLAHFGSRLLGHTVASKPISINPSKNSPKCTDLVFTQILLI